MTIMTLNIGTKTINADTIDEHDALNAVRTYLGGTLRSIFTETDNGDEEEDTIVVTTWVDTSGGTQEVHSRLTGAIYNMALNLDQECIAWSLDFGEHGYLTGPRAASWGDFDPALFITEPKRQPAPAQSFIVDDAPIAQRETIRCVTELHRETGTEWFAGPYGEAYTTLPDSEDVDRIWVVSPSGRLRRAPTIV